MPSFARPLHILLGSTLFIAGTAGAQFFAQVGDLSDPDHALWQGMPGMDDDMDEDENMTLGQVAWMFDRYDQYVNQSRVGYSYDRSQVRYEQYEDFPDDQPYSRVEYSDSVDRGPQCNDAYSNMQQLISGDNSCNSDGDCLVYNNRCEPFRICGAAVNKETYRSINNIRNDYEDICEAERGCASCAYLEARCQSGQCVAVPRGTQKTRSYSSNNNHYYASSSRRSTSHPSDLECFPIACNDLPRGCRYRNADYDGSCKLSCGDVVCNDDTLCPLIACAQPGPGCRFRDPPTNSSCPQCGPIVCDDDNDKRLIPQPPSYPTPEPIPNCPEPPPRVSGCSRTCFTHQNGCHQCWNVCKRARPF